MGIRKVVVVLLLCQALAGCAINLHGSQSTGNGASTTTVASSVNAGAGQAKFSAFFGSPPSTDGAGGQVGFSRGAAAILVLGLAIAEAAQFVAAQFRGPPPTILPSVPPRASIADTCSCYGWKPQAAVLVE